METDTKTSPGIAWHFSSEENAYKGAASITPPQRCQIIEQDHRFGTSWHVLTGENFYRRSKGRQSFRTKVLYAGWSSELKK